MNGETKQIMGDYLVELATLTGFEAKWIVSGTGPKQRVYANTAQQEHVLRAMQTMPQEYTALVVKIVDTVAHSPTGGEAASKEKAA